MPCGAPCTRLPCDLRCARNISGCGHRCPGLCGEECLTEAECRECAKSRGLAQSKEMQQQVDVVMGCSLWEHDPDQSPLVRLPACGHVLTVESLDGLLELGKYYRQSQEERKFKDEGEVKLAWTGLRDLTELPPDVKRIPTCPHCRAPISNIRRYGRVLNRLQLALTQTKFVIGARNQSHRLKLEHTRLAQWIAELERKWSSGPTAAAGRSESAPAAAQASSSATAAQSAAAAAVAMHSRLNARKALMAHLRAAHDFHLEVQLGNPVQKVFGMEMAFHQVREPTAAVVVAAAAAAASSEPPAPAAAAPADPSAASSSSSSSCAPSPLSSVPRLIPPSKEPLLLGQGALFHARALLVQWASSVELEAPLTHSQCEHDKKVVTPEAKSKAASQRQLQAVHQLIADFKRASALAIKWIAQCRDSHSQRKLKAALFAQCMFLLQYLEALSRWKSDKELRNEGKVLLSEHSKEQLPLLQQAHSHLQTTYSPSSAESDPADTAACLKMLAERLVRLERADPFYAEVSVEEKRAIFAAMSRDVGNAVGSFGGHWYQCGNGHVYAIGELQRLRTNSSLQAADPLGALAVC